MSKCLVAARCRDPFAGERAEPPLPRGTVDERETCMTSVACSRSRHADPATRFTEYGIITIRVNAGPRIPGSLGISVGISGRARRLARLTRCGASASLRGRNGMDADVVVVGAGLAGLVATAELADAGRRVIILDQEPRRVSRRAGVLVVRRADVRRLPRTTPAARARLPQSSPWRTGWARPRSTGPKTTGLGSGLRHMSSLPPVRSGPGWPRQGMRWFPIVQWAERGGYGVSGAGAHGNSVPRFHVTWGTGPGVLEPFLRRVADGRRQRYGSSCDSGTESPPWRCRTAR